MQEDEELFDEDPTGRLLPLLMKSFHYADVAFLVLNKALLNLDACGIIFGGMAITGS